jgi:hypothetical protein
VKLDEHFPGYVGIVFGLIGLLVANGVFTHYMWVSGLDEGDAEMLKTQIRMYTIAVGLPAGCLVGYGIGWLYQRTRRKANKEEKAQ